MTISEKEKAKKYTAMMNSHYRRQAVINGWVHPNYRTCAYSSLGELGLGTISDISCAARYYNMVISQRQSVAPRLDGKSPDELAVAFKLRCHADIQFAIARGNAAMALHLAAGAY